MHSLEIYENEINDILNKNLNYSLLCFGGRQKHTIISWVLKLRGERKRAVQCRAFKKKLGWIDAWNCDAHFIKILLAYVPCVL